MISLLFDDFDLLLQELTTLKIFLMKILATLLSLLVCLNTNAQCTDIVNIPDQNFKKALVELGVTTDSDGNICRATAEAFNNPIIVSGKEISDLTGIEAFTGANFLDFSNNNITSLNIPGLKNCISLNCSNNQINDLQLGTSQIQSINCSNNKLTVLSIKGQEMLVDIDVSNNNLTTFKVGTSNTNLSVLNISNNNLTSLVLVNGPVFELGVEVHILVEAKDNPNLSCVQTYSGFVLGNSDFGSAKPSENCGYAPSVELSQYKVNIVDNKPVITWETIDESTQEIASYKVIRKNSNGNTKVVGTLNSATRADVNNYSFTDDNPLSSATYSVSQVDARGVETSLGSLPETNVALPVELSSFDVTADNNDATISWSTSTEVNNSHFNVQRSVDGVDFETIATIDGNGTSTESIEYSYVDYEVGADVETVYYRLEQVDFDGATEVFTAKSITFASAQSQTSMYPNVAQAGEQITIKGSDIEEVKIYDIAGKILDSNSYNGESQIKISTDNLTSGMYIVVVNNQKGRKLVVK